MATAIRDSFNSYLIHPLFQGTQADSNGLVVGKNALEILNKLICQRPGQQPTVPSLNARVVPGHLSLDEKLLLLLDPAKKGLTGGGTCSPMSLFFAKKFLEIKEQAKNPYDLLDRVAQLGEQELKKSNERFRNVQHAFNCMSAIMNDEIDLDIQRDGFPQDHDYIREQIQIRLNYYDLEIDFSSGIIRLGTDTTQEQLERLLIKLPDGTYFVRIFNSCSEPVPISGHSMVLVKEEAIGIFYDPNQGANAFPVESSVSYVVCHLYQDGYAGSQMDMIMFCRVKPKNKSDKIQESIHAYCEAAKVALSQRNSSDVARCIKEMTPYLGRLNPDQKRIYAQMQLAIIDYHIENHQLWLPPSPLEVLLV